MLPSEGAAAATCKSKVNPGRIKSTEEETGNVEEEEAQAVWISHTVFS